MRGTRERTHDDTVHRLEKHRSAKIVPVTAIFGANAAGKSLFVEALSFAREFITGAMSLGQKIPVAPFLFSKTTLSAPSSFSFLLCAEEQLWRYAFSVTPSSVVSESLALLKGTTEQLQYSRSGKTISVSKHLANRDRLSMIAEGTRENQLFLNNLVYQNAVEFAPVFNWFKSSLVIITPSLSFTGIDQFADRTNPLHGVVEKALASFDTGIAELVSQSVPIESIPLSIVRRESLERDIPEGGVRREYVNGELILFQKQAGVLTASRVMAMHPTDWNDGMTIPLTMESEGTRRLIDLLPAFADLGYPQSKCVYVIDELDRGLHAKILDYLVRTFVSQSTPQGRSQVIFTTHNLELMSQAILRRDEMWLVEKNGRGEARLVPFSDFNGAMRNDSDIRKSYLQGRLGGIPRIVPFAFSESNDEEGTVGNLLVSEGGEEDVVYNRPTRFRVEHHAAM